MNNKHTLWHNQGKCRERNKLPFGHHMITIQVIETSQTQNVSGIASESNKQAFCLLGKRNSFIHIVSGSIMSLKRTNGLRNIKHIMHVDYHPVFKI